MALWEYLWAWSWTTKLLLHLNWNSTDSSGNWYNWTDASITYVWWIIWSGSASFNGTSSYIEIPDATGLRYQTWWVNGNLSVSIRFKPSTISWVHTLVWKWSNWWTNTDWIIFQNWATINWAILWANNVATTWNILTIWVWTHIVMTLNSSKNIVVYINSISSATATNTTSPTYWTYDPVRIWQNTNTNYLNWVIDEVIIENRVWTPEEIKRYYTYSRWMFWI